MWWTCWLFWRIHDGNGTKPPKKIAIETSPANDLQSTLDHVRKKTTLVRHGKHDICSILLPCFFLSETKMPTLSGGFPWFPWPGHLGSWGKFKCKAQTDEHVTNFTNQSLQSRTKYTNTSTANDLATVAWQSGQISSNIYFVWPWQCSSCSARRPDSNQPCKVSGIPWVRWRCGSLIWLVESSLFKVVGVAWRTVFSAVPGELFEEFARCCISVSWLYFIFFKISPSPNGPNGTKLCKFQRH